MPGGKAARIQALALAVSLGGKVALSLVGDRTPPELFFDGMAYIA